MKLSNKVAIVTGATQGIGLACAERMIAEGAKVLEEGIAIRASDVDIAAILGYNWPVYTGGPMFWGDTVGLQKVVDGFEHFTHARIRYRAFAHNNKLGLV